MRTKKLVSLAIVLVFLIAPAASLEINNLQKIKLEASASPIKVACVGDSITQITGYPDDLQSMLGSNYSVTNFGVTGSTALLNSWKPYMGQPQFWAAEGFDPQIVVIMLGTNDVFQELQPYNGSWESDYSKLIVSFEHLKSNPQIFIVSAPPMFSNDTDLSPQYLSNVIIPKTYDLANQMNLPSVDVYDAFGNNPDLLKADGVHPNSDGAQIIASQVYDAITAQNDSTT